MLCVVSSEGREEDVHHLLGESWPRVEGEVAPFFSGDLVEGNTECVLVLAYPWKLVGLALVTVLFLLEPRASDLKPIKNEIKSSTKEETCASKKRRKARVKPLCGAKCGQKRMWSGK